VDSGGPANSIERAPKAERVARFLASPTGVLVIVPALVIAVGITILLLGRRATLEASDGMAKRQLAGQAVDVQRDVSFALDQADPLLASLRVLADRNAPVTETAKRMRDLQIGRPGIANLSIAFPDGTLRGSFIDPTTNDVGVQESVIGAGGTTRTNYGFANGAPEVVGTEKTNYDPRTRPHWEAALNAKARVWMPPRLFFTSHNTGMTVTEPVYAVDGSVQAVTTVDFDVTAMSAFIYKAPFEGARTVLFAADGTILAFPSKKLPDVAIKEHRLLRAADYGDPALTALMTHLGDPSTSQGIQFRDVDTSDGQYLVAISHIGGKRAGITAPVDWYLATLVPERVLLGPTHRLEKQSVLASVGALIVALGVALMFAWNLVRMRRAVGVAREAARSAEARARELGSYRLVARLGVGGMGEVWKAEHRLLAREAAIKLVRAETLRDPAYAPKVRERFRREAQTLASMRSQHTIALYDYGVTDDGTFFYVMELLDGVDLDRLVRDQGPLPAARVIKLLVQACQSLAEAHDSGLLHRDIKPANLFVCRCADEVDVLKVLDFGIVHTMADPIADPLDIISLPPVPVAAEAPPAGQGPTSGRLTTIGSVIGTPGYIAPEQAMVGSKVDGRADLYALGCVAWWLLTQNEVFRRDTENASMMAHVTDPVPALRPLVKGWLPPGLEGLVLAMLAKDPDDRPPDARALIAQLRAIEIPSEHAWTDASALAWWNQTRPTAKVASSEAATAAMSPMLLVPSVESTRGKKPPPTMAGLHLPQSGPPTMPQAQLPASGPPTMPMPQAASTDAKTGEMPRSFGRPPTID
jgi:serine/threonine protein kinase